MADAGPPRRAGGARRAKERVYRARERAGRAREWDGGARAKFTASTAPYEYVGKNGVTFTLTSLVADLARVALWGTFCETTSLKPTLLSDSDET